MFIALTDASYGRVLINIRHIVAMFPNTGSGGTFVHTIDNRKYEVSESLAKIENALSRNSERVVSIMKD